MIARKRDGVEAVHGWQVSHAEYALKACEGLLDLFSQVSYSNWLAKSCVAMGSME